MSAYQSTPLPSQLRPWSAHSNVTSRSPRLRSRQSAWSQRRSSRSVASTRDIREHSLEVGDDAVPGQGLRGKPRRRAELAAKLHVAGDAPRRADERGRIVERREKSRAAVAQVLARRRVAVRHDAKTARRRLERHVAEG